MWSEIKYQAIRIASVNLPVFKLLMLCPTIPSPIPIGKIMILTFKDRVTLISIPLLVLRQKKKQ